MPKGDVPAYVAAAREIAKLRPKGRDPDELFAKVMAGRRFRDGPTRDGGRDLAYIKRFRPYGAAPTMAAPYVNLAAAAIQRWAKDGDPAFADVAAKLAAQPRPGRPPTQDRLRLVGADREFVELVRAGVSKAGAAKILGFHRTMAQKIAERPAVRQALAGVNTKLRAAA